MEIKENLSYTNDHEWIKIDGNTALVGITDFAPVSYTHLTLPTR